jgi:hypothetical protein
MELRFNTSFHQHLVPSIHPCINRSFHQCVAVNAVGGSMRFGALLYDGSEEAALALLAQRWLVGGCATRAGRRLLIAWRVGGFRVVVVAVVL